MRSKRLAILLRLYLFASLSGFAFRAFAETIPPTLSAPAANAVRRSPVGVSFFLPENALSGSVTLTFAGDAIRVLTLAASQETAGAHAFSLNTASPISSPAVSVIAGGTTIPDGIYAVTIGYRNAAGDPDATATSENVRIDTNPPSFDLPAPIEIEASGSAGAVVDYTAIATDPGGSGIATSSFSPATGSTFPLGATTVFANATDNAGNTAASSFTVIVRDTSAPVLTNMPSDITVEATSAEGATVVYANPTAKDLVDGVLPATATAPSGSTFPLGTTIVILSATDTTGNTSSGAFTVRVVDTTAPEIANSPGDIVVDAASAAGAIVTYQPTALDLVDGPLAVTCIPLSGSVFPIGVTTVNCSVSDAAGNSVATSFNVTVIDTLPMPTTNPAQSIKATHATLEGSVINPRGGPVAVMFLYGTTDPPSTETPVQNLVGNELPASVALDALLPGTTYFFRIRAENSVGTRYGSVLQFTTASPPVESLNPVLSITSPNSDTVPEVITIAGTVRDDTEIVSLTVRLNNLELPLDAPVNPAPNESATWSVSNVVPENGSNALMVEAVDPSGNRAFATAAFQYVNNRPAISGSYAAVLKPALTSGDKMTGLITATVAPSGVFTGTVMANGARVPISGVLRNDGAARFFPRLEETFVVVLPGVPDQTLGRIELSVDESSGMSGVLATADGGEATADFAGRLAPFSKKNPVPSQYLNRPASRAPTLGYYTVAFLSKPQEPPVDAVLYPQGDGVGVLRIRRNGGSSLSGSLADGTKFVAAAKLRADGTLPVFVPLYGQQGSVAGDLALQDLPDSDLTGVDIFWVRPAQPNAVVYRSGWPGGIHVDAVGTKYSGPVSVDFGQGPPNLTSGNATLSFSNGLLSGTVRRSASINPINGTVKALPPPGEKFALSLRPGSGKFLGRFRHTDTTTVGFSGVVLNKGANRGGTGYFLKRGTHGIGGSGLVQIRADE